MSTVLKAILALAVIWAVVGVIMWQSGERTVTAESLTAWIEENPLSEGERNRERHIRQLADQYNRLGYEERRNLRENGQQDGPPDFVSSMTEEERRLFVNLTVSESFNQLMQALNEMDPEERRKLAERALDQVREDGMTPARMAEMEENEREIMEKVTSEGLRAYYEEASADTKMDLAPVLEQMQKNLRTPAYHDRGNR